MDIIAGLSGLLIGAVIAWQLAQGMAAAEMSRSGRGCTNRSVTGKRRPNEPGPARPGSPSRRPPGPPGCEQGREDVLSLTRALAQHITQPGDGSTPG